MKSNRTTLVASILMFISVISPWFFTNITGIEFNETELHFLFGRLYYLPEFGTYFRHYFSSTGASIRYRYFWVPLILVICSGSLGLKGCSTIGKRGKDLITLAGTLTILSTVVFVIGLALDVRTAPWGIIYSATFESHSVISCLFLGFFLALIAGLLMFVSLKKHPV